MCIIYDIELYVQDVFEKYQDWTVLTKTEMNNEWNIHFLQNSPLSIQHIYFSEFLIG